MWYQSQVATKGMANHKDINATNSQANVTQNAAGKKVYSKKRNVANTNRKMSLEIERNEGLTFKEPFTTKMNENDAEVLLEDVLLKKE